MELGPQQPEAEAEEKEEETASEPAQIKDDKVSSILSSVSAFASDEDCREEKEAVKENDTTVSGILGSLSFLK